MTVIVRDERSGLFCDEKTLLLDLLRHRAEEEPMDAIHLAAVDWTRFLRLAKNHRVYPVLAAFLHKRMPGIPDYVKAELDTDSRYNRLKMLSLAAEMSRVSACLSSGGVRSLVLKGPLLAQDLYGDLSKRTSKDLDILVPAEKLDEIRILLADLGYECEKEQLPNVLNGWKWRHHHVSFFIPRIRCRSRSIGVWRRGQEESRILRSCGRAGASIRSAADLSPTLDRRINFCIWFITARVTGGSGCAGSAISTCWPDADSTGPPVRSYPSGMGRSTWSDRRLYLLPNCFKRLFLKSWKALRV
ncbi:nucleotidyltransferase family protein [Cohnella ginsengisoli]|uniref:Nucleotidyltransferase family protein n=1 Tax=Cohnella ginsengisoli TaxID=425004 RepID=A0A9X4KIK8_9BACL|nr:nucleotidyltransferase family protein [Cohnella ginsengisoli]MDG0790787.1 nucleotidyltransferase family protein [Cohnella ginsengisoli]